MGVTFCTACNRDLKAEETKESHIHDYLKFDASQPMDLGPLKEETRLLLADSSNRGRKWPEGDDLIDWSILREIAIINGNPEVVPTGSCSGHPLDSRRISGQPYVSVVFRDSESRDYYLDKVKKAGYGIVQSDPFRMGFFSQNFPAVKVREEWNITSPNKKECTPSEAKAYWDDWVRILGTARPTPT